MSKFLGMREEEFELELVNSLKEISYDDRNKEYMTELSDRTVHFDKVSNQYAILKGKNNLKSIDGLYTEGFSKIFIEFKNGRIVSGNEVNKNKLEKIEGKILSSETILCDMIGEEQEYMKKQKRTSLPPKIRTAGIVFYYFAPSAHMVM